MSVDPIVRTTFTSDEATEIRDLLDGLPGARLAVRRMSLARLRRIGLALAQSYTGASTRETFDELVEAGVLKIDETAAKAAIKPKPNGSVFRVAVGTSDDPVDADWDAFDERYQWFGQRPRSISSGVHLFVLAVGHPWRSRVVGLYEAVTAGADRLPDSPDPERWPWALGIRPLAAIPPHKAVQVEGQRGPQSGLPENVSDLAAQRQLYQAVAASPPPPGPSSLEQKVQELEWRDVMDDVLTAVSELGDDAREPAVLDRALEIGGWTEEELKARAWYTGSGSTSHVRHILRQVLNLETGSKGRLSRSHGIYSVNEPETHSSLGVTYRPALADDGPTTEAPALLADLSELDRATKRHKQLQDRLAETLTALGIEPRSPGSWEPEFDLAFEHKGRRFVVEVKSSDPVSHQQVRLGIGQVLEYRHLLSMMGPEVEAILLIESEPPEPWVELARELGVQLLPAAQLDASLAPLLAVMPSQVYAVTSTDEE